MNQPSPSSLATCETLRRSRIKMVGCIASRAFDSPLTCPTERERLYGKDMHCPPEWRNWINTSGVLPDMVIPGATGDILSEKVETLMSYLGVSDTCTHNTRDPYPWPCLQVPDTTSYFQSHHCIRIPARLTGRTSCVTLRMKAVHSGS